MITKEWLEAETKWLNDLELRYCAVLREMGIDAVANAKIIVSKEIDNELLEVRVSIRNGIEWFEKELANWDKVAQNDNQNNG
jgi:hypothetical protein